MKEENVVEVHGLTPRIMMIIILVIPSVMHASAYTQRSTDGNNEQGRRMKEWEGKEREHKVNHLRLFLPCLPFQHLWHIFSMPFRRRLILFETEIPCRVNPSRKRKEREREKGNPSKMYLMLIFLLHEMTLPLEFTALNLKYYKYRKKEKWNQWWSRFEENTPTFSLWRQSNL